MAFSFGANTAATRPGLFGVAATATPSTGGLFGSMPAAGGGIFGTNQVSTGIN